MKHIRPERLARELATKATAASPLGKKAMRLSIMSFADLWLRRIEGDSIAPEEYLEARGPMASDWPHRTEMIAEGLQRYPGYRCPRCGYLCKAQMCRLRYPRERWKQRRLEELVKEGRLSTRDLEECSEIGWPWELKRKRGHAWRRCPACDCLSSLSDWKFYGKRRDQANTNKVDGSR